LVLALERGRAYLINCPKASFFGLHEKACLLRASEKFLQSPNCPSKVRWIKEYCDYCQTVFWSKAGTPLADVSLFAKLRLKSLLTCQTANMVSGRIICKTTGNNQKYTIKSEMCGMVTSHQVKGTMRFMGTQSSIL
jgi:hypothetical protein